MKRQLGLNCVLAVFGALIWANGAGAQTANFSQMNGLQPINVPASTATPAAGGTFMSDEDMSFGADNEVVFEQNAASVPMMQKNVPTASLTPTDAPAAQSVSQGETLTQTLQQNNPPQNSGLKLPNVSGTWVDELATSVPQAINAQKSVTNDNASAANSTLSGLMADSRLTSKRSNASVFDISGIMLRMNLAQAEKAMMVRGFKRVSQKLEIPNFIKWRNEETCRNNGVVGYERLMNCVVEMAKKNNYQYVETAKYAKFSTKEEVEIKLTSNFTGNKIYRIMYKSMSGKVIGSGAKAAYLRNIKVFDFWKKVNQKYGTPDNKEEVTWGLGMNKPYMKASTGFLVLEDPMLRELDYTRMSREDQRFMNTDLYSF